MMTSAEAHNHSTAILGSTERHHCEHQKAPPAPESRVPNLKP